MSVKYNHRLRELALASALPENRIPILVCDEELFICAKSSGAERYVDSPRVGTNLGGFTDPENFSKVPEQGFRAVEALKYRDSVYDLIIYRERLENENCFVVVCHDGRLMLSESGLSERMQFCVDRLSAQLRGAVELMLNSSRDDGRHSAEFDRCCRRLIRVRKLIRAEFGKYMTGDDEFFSPRLLVESFFDICERALPAYGCRLSVEMGSISPENISDVDRKQALSYFCALLFNLLSISSDRRVTIDCGYSSLSSVKIDFSTASEETGSGNLDALALSLTERGFPFGVDLMVSCELAESLGWEISYLSSGGRLTLRTVLPVTEKDYPADLRLFMPLDQTLQELVNVYLSEL